MKYKRTPKATAAKRADYKKHEEEQKVLAKKRFQESLKEELEKVVADTNYFDREFYIDSLTSAINQI